ncbi:hypothetical protein BS78_08G015400 [Paspalum vaginatum]|nr:hypothetical protein BS78_08G015400 [Paspalum vaginatum]
MTAAFPDRPCTSMLQTSRIHPSEPTTTAATPPPPPPGPQTAAAAAAAAALQQQQYTVWKRSSMGFQGTDGFSVYDAAGALAFRLDNYSRNRKLFAGELVLMDGHGAPLLALRPQIFSMHDQWNCYKVSSEESQGKRTRSHQLLFSMSKCSVLQKGHEAEVSMSSSSGRSTASGRTAGLHLQGRRSSFWVEGCFRRRSSKICDGDGVEVARIVRKKAEAPSSSLTLVFSLVVQPGVDCAMAMAFVVVLDRICWRPYTPMICSS